MQRNFRAAWLLFATVCLASCGGGDEPLMPARSSEIAPDDLSYPDPNMFTEGEPIEPLVPTVRGKPTNYMVTPDLPAGLRLTFDGRIIGTPTEPRGPGTYLVSAGNSAGVSSFGVRITIVGRFKVGGTVTGLTAGGLILENNGQESLAVNADGTFEFAGTLSAGGAYSVTVATQPPGQTCVVSRGSGLVTNIDVGDIAVTCSGNATTSTFLINGPALQFPCADPSLLQDKLIYAFEIEAVDLATTPQLPLPGCDPEQVSLDAEHAWVYLRHPADSSVSVYAGNPLAP